MDDLPPPIKITPNSLDTSNQDDDSIVDIKVKNPFAKFFDWIKSFLKRNQNITIKIPIIGVLVTLFSFSAGLGSGYNWGFSSALSKFFPDSSPVLHRTISVDGVIQNSTSGKYYLRSENNYTWTLKPLNSAVRITDYIGKEVTVKGNLTKEKGVIEVSELILLEAVAQIAPNTLIPSNTPNLSISSNPTALPDLYPSLSWDTNQKKLLIFTSGKRKIEQEGIYLESAQVNEFPADFINYYLEQLKAVGFKETLNSISPEGVVVTYAKDDIFLTFGIKNIYKGSGAKKQLIGYKAFIEHN
ncbi:hypothetical protein HY383_01490 [Candidatus Daviesbacteria bacterium]|nr:hypothetical protein [Candidatus Daviesbacteria bacterium]